MSLILVVDDDADIRLLLRLELSAEGHRIAEAADGQEALDAMEADLPDLVLLDVMMPVLDGWGVLEALDPATAPPVVVVTAMASDGDRHVADLLERGALDVIAKPFDPGWLVRLVNAVLLVEPDERAEYRQGRLAQATRVMRGRQAAAGGFAAVAIAVVALAWLQDVPDISARDAVTATEQALEHAGLRATVEPDPTRTIYAPRTREAVEVWAVHATVRAEPIEVRLARSGAQPVAIDDRTPDGSAYVLSQAEYESLANGVDDPARARTIRRNIALTAAAVLVVALSLTHAFQAARSKESL